MDVKSLSRAVAAGTSRTPAGPWQERGIPAPESDGSAPGASQALEKPLPQALAIDAVWIAEFELCLGIVAARTRAAGSPSGAMLRSLPARERATQLLPATRGCMTQPRCISSFRPRSSRGLSTVA